RPNRRARSRPAIRHRRLTVMRFATLFAAAAAVLVCQPEAASYPCGIYARIDQVELGPSETSPQWIKIHGDFILVKTSGRLSEPRGVFRHSPWDALPVALAAGHGALLLLAPAAPLVAGGLWWNSNTVSHLFIHRPFFRSRAANRLFACYLTLVLGIPQTVWRD